MTFYYYIKLRNEPGVRGARGDPGPKGQKGSNGVCTIDTSCGLFKTVEISLKKYLWKNFLNTRELYKNKKRVLKLNNSDLKILEQVNMYFDMLKTCM